MPAIEIDSVSFSFGLQRVLRGISVSVEGGSVLAVFGPNGAGKTTLIKILAGILRPSAGTVRIEGATLQDDPANFRRLIGVVSHHPYLYPQLTGLENLDFYARLHGLERPRSQAEAILEQMGLSFAGRGQTSTYSRGMLQRLAIGRALLHRPRVLLLDEPFTGLDRESHGQLAALLRATKDGQRTVVVTTHDVEGGLDLADRAVVLCRGRLALDCDAKGLDSPAFVRLYDQAVAGDRA
jgi:heme exporter protein A